MLHVFKFVRQDLHGLCELRRIRWERLRYRHLGIALINASICTRGALIPARINLRRAIHKNALARGSASYLSSTRLFVRDVFIKPVFASRFFCEIPRSDNEI